ncbi:MAG: hypothetical protein JO023_02330 [Chloroflexi bacterium]|nr:hypothetical protein [Chloroflexota bacterium]
MARCGRRGIRRGDRLFGPGAALASACALAIALLACSGPSPTPTPVRPPPPATTPTSAASPTTALPPGAGVPIIPAIPSGSPIASPPSLAITSGKTASDMRTELDRILQEHALLLEPVMVSTVGDHQPENAAAGATLDRNSETLSQWLGAVYGLDTQRTFLDLWRARIGLFTTYAAAAAAHDAGGQQQAQSGLAANGSNLAALLAGTAEGLSPSDLETPLSAQADAVLHTADALAGGDDDLALASMDDAATHSVEFGDLLATSIANQFPTRFPGDVTRDDVNLRATLSLLFQKQIYLEGLGESATANHPEQAAAFSRLADQNINQMGSYLGDVYNQQFGEQLVALWRAQVTSLSAYTEAVQAGDVGRQQAAMKDLDTWRQNMDSLWSGANPLLASGRVDALLRVPVLRLTGSSADLVDQRWSDGYGQLYQSAREMEGFEDAVSQASADLYPSRFGTSSSAQANLTPQPASGAATGTPFVAPIVGATAPTPVAGAPIPTGTPGPTSPPANLVTPIPIPTVAASTPISIPAAGAGATSAPTAGAGGQTPVVVVTVPPPVLVIPTATSTPTPAAASGPSIPIATLPTGAGAASGTGGSSGGASSTTGLGGSFPSLSGTATGGEATPAGTGAAGTPRAGTPGAGTPSAGGTPGAGGTPSSRGTPSTGGTPRAATPTGG